MKTLVRSGHEDKTVYSIEFGINTSEDVVQQSHVEITNHDIYDSFEQPAENGLMDPKMGTCNSSKCPTCDQEQKYCMGHYGHLNLSNYLFPFGFLKDIVKILKCICKTCGHVLLSERDMKIHEKELRKPNISYIQKKNIRAVIIKKSSKVRQCRFCNDSNGSVKKLKSISMICHKKYVLKDKQKKFLEQFENHSSEIRNLMGGGVTLLRPYDVFKLFQMVPLKHYKFLGMSAKNNLKISNLIFKNIPVPPTCIRPSTQTATENTSREDDITILLRMQIGDNKLHDMHNEYARMINPNATCIRSLKEKKVIRGMVQRLAGKKGRFRGNIMGKRTNFTGRTVISPDPSLKINEISIPLYCAMRLTFTEKVTSYNINHLRQLVINGDKCHPGAVAYASANDNEPQQPMSHLKLMMTKVLWNRLDKEERRYNAAKKLKIGDYVQRHIDNGDVVLFNRQPSLHRLSFQAFNIVVKKEKTFSFNPCCCNPFNADFDGDEMNVHFPQTYEAKAEAIELISSIKNITSPNSGEPLTAPLQDILTAAYLLTSKETFYTENEFRHLILPIVKLCPPGKIMMMPRPVIMKPIKLYTGKQLMSLIISPFGKLSQNKKIRIPDSRINLVVETGANPVDYLNPNDSLVVIHNSELLMGQLPKKLLGGGSKLSIFFRLLKDVSDVASCESMERLCNIALPDLMLRGFSIGITDVSPSRKLREKKKQLVYHNFDICEDFIKSYEKKTLACDPGCSMEETLESRISSQLSKIRDEGGKECKTTLPKSNAPLIMAMCNSKGSFINISQMSFCVGQQIIEGKRVKDIRGTKRTLLFYLKNCRSPMSQGFVSNSFYSGLNIGEFHFHAMSGREGLIDTAVKTSETGYLQRRLIKFLEDLAIRYDKSVRDFAGNLVQFQYGIDGFDPSKLETTYCPCDFTRELYHALQDYTYDENKIGSDIKQVLEELLSYQKRKFENLDESLIQTVTDYYHSKEGAEFGITRSQLRLFIENCYEKYFKAIIEPGTAIGVICGQSVGEPATQMTLKTFHFAGVASMNITRGVPRMQEIMNAVASIKTPISTVYLTGDTNENFAKQIQLKIQPIFLRDIIYQSYEVMSSAGMFFYLILNNVKMNQFSIYPEDLEIVLNSVKIRNYGISVIYKDNSHAHIEIFSESEINCQLVLTALGKIQIKGMKNVKRTVIQRNEQGKHNIYVEGGKLRDLFFIKGLDQINTHSNHIQEIFEVFGIDAAEDMIVNELNAVMGAHNLTPDIRHVNLLAAVMCYTGEVCGFQRSGISKSKNSVICLASFEKTLDHLLEASYHNQKDKLHGISDCITFGKTIPLGTGIPTILMNDNSNKNLKRREPITYCK